MLEQQSCRPLSKTRANTCSQPNLASSWHLPSPYPYEAQPRRQPLQRNDEKSKLEETSVFLPESPSKQYLSSNQPAKQQLGWCLLHKKQLQIMCLTDKLRICPHCALFSTHRQHELRTVKQMSDFVKQRVQEWRECNQRKLQLDRRLNSSIFREAMIAKITTHKTKLIAEIKQKFKELQENIKLAEKRAFDDVAKKFKLVAQKITQLDRQDQQAHQLYQKWHSSCQPLFQISNFDAKANILATNFEKCKEGISLMQLLQEKADRKIQTIEKIVSSIKVLQSQAVANSIFNYLHIAFEQSQSQERQGKVPIFRVEPIVQKEQPQEPLQFNSAKVIKEPSSPVSHSHKRVGSANQRSQQRNSHKNANNNNRKSSQLVSALQLQAIIAEFCSKQQLETLDLSNSELLDSEIYELLAFIKTKKKVKSLKLGRNKITSEGFSKILDLIPLVTNLNLSFNFVTEEALCELLRSRHKVPQLRIVNLSNNGLNQRRCQTAIQQLKKQGLIVTI